MRHGRVPPLASSENLFTFFPLRFVQEVELIEESLVDGCPDPHVKLEDEGDRVRDDGGWQNSKQYSKKTCMKGMITWGYA